MRLPYIMVFVLALAFCAAGLEVELQPGPGDGKDTFVSSANPTTNYGSHFHMYVGRSPDTGGALRAFIEFTGLDEYIADGYTCTEAILELETFAVTSGPAEVYDVYRVEEDWDEDTIIWDYQPAFGGTPVVFEDPWPGDFIVDITPIVAEWFNGTAEHYGICIKHENEESEENGNFGCYSSNDSSSNDRPKLTVTLTGEAVGSASLGEIKAVFR
jgi:hypothetical protein